MILSGLPANCEQFETMFKVICKSFRTTRGRIGVATSKGSRVLSEVDSGSEVVSGVMRVRAWRPPLTSSQPLLAFRSPRAPERET